MDGLVDALRRRYGRRDWAPVTHGFSGAQVYRGDSVHAKVLPVAERADPGARLDSERAALEWLAGTGIPAPEVVEYGGDGDREWLVTTTLPGRAVCEDWPAHRRTDVLAAMADAARRLHSVPVERCPLDRRLAVRLDLARRAVDDGLVQPPDRPVGHLVAELLRTRPDAEDLVVCHGDYCVPNVLLDPDSLALTGVLDVGRLGVADRRTDLALATRSIANPRLNPQYGLAAADGFLARYGWPADRDDPDFAFYRLLTEFT